MEVQKWTTTWDSDLKQQKRLTNKNKAEDTGSRSPHTTDQLPIPSAFFYFWTYFWWIPLGTKNLFYSLDPDVPLVKENFVPCGLHSKISPIIFLINSIRSPVKIRSRINDVNHWRLLCTAHKAEVRNHVIPLRPYKEIIENAYKRRRYKVIHRKRRKTEGFASFSVFYGVYPFS